jgi:hypothetical protein
MPQISSTGKLLMATNDMTDVLKHPHPDVPLATVGNDTITALSQLAANFKNKFQKPLAPELVQAPIKAAENKQPAALVQPILTSLLKQNYQTMSQRLTNVNPSCNSALLLRVVTPMMSRAASKRVPAWTHNLSPRKLSQDHFWDKVNDNHEIELGTNHWTNIHL